ncbi:MAG: hypothetical protein RR346_04365 [Bacteroidales bacterium]
MNTIKSLFFALVAILVALTTSCNGNAAKQTSDAAVAGETPVVLTIDEVLANADSLNGKKIVVEGVCTHICQHGGKKIFLMGSDDHISLRCEANEAIGQFNPDAVNNVVQVSGVLAEERIDEAYLVAWEEQLNAETDEKHGENTTAGCATEKKNRGEEVESNTPAKRIAGFRERIAARAAQEGKNYLSFYHLNADQYEVK